MPHLPNAHRLERQARAIVESLAGTWRREKGMCCCPAHDDRTPSLSVTLGRKAILFHCFAGCSNEDVIAALERCGVRSRNLFDGNGPVDLQPKKNLPFSPNARRLWQSATPITDSPAARYLVERGLLPASDQLRYLGGTPLGPRGAVQFLPAMLAAVTTDSGIIAIHRTFLDRSSARLADFERPKRALGSLGCGAVRLAPPGRALSRSGVTRIMTERFGGSDALGRWSVRDAHAALEVAQVQYLKALDQISLSTSVDDADQFFSSLEARLPIQSNRSDEQIEWQQFATSPRLAWLAARACALTTGEFVLEPSAGTGMLAVWAAKAGSRLALNEISPHRRDCLSALFPAARVTGHDAELIDELLDPAVTPSAVLMNPPYSHGVERGHDSRTGSRHLRSAWNRLTSGGRLVAIMPEWFDCAKFMAGLKGPVSLRLNATVERAFVRHGTGITTRLLVLDKAGGSHEPVATRTNDFGQLVELVDALPARSSLDAVPEQASLPARAPFRLFAAPRKPLPTPAGITPAASAIVSLTYQSLDTPAPLAPQVGHYLPYRPSRIVIDGAAEHPTPLVESVAMGSIAAPKLGEPGEREPQAAIGPGEAEAAVIAGDHLRAHEGLECGRSVR